MAGVLIYRAYRLDAVALKCKEVRAIVVDALVEEAEVVEADAELDDEKVAVFFWLDLVELGAVGVCAVCKVARDRGCSRRCSGDRRGN